MSAALDEVARVASRRGQGHGSELSDSELLRAIAAGDLTALGSLYDRHAPAVRAFARRASPRPDDADDLVHEVFLTLVKAAASYDGRPDARPFLLGIAARLLHRRRRALGRFAEILGDFAHAFVPPAPPTPEASASIAQETRLFERALARLSPEKRLVFLMIEGEGLSGEDVALALAIPVATVRTRLHHARKDLRAAMSRGSQR